MSLGTPQRPPRNCACYGFHNETRLSDESLIGASSTLRAQGPRRRGLHLPPVPLRGVMRMKHPLVAVGAAGIVSTFAFSLFVLPQSSSFGVDDVMETSVLLGLAFGAMLVVGLATMAKTLQGRRRRRPASGTEWTTHCPVCGAFIRRRRSFCPNCGADLRFERETQLET